MKRSAEEEEGGFFAGNLNKEHSIDFWKELADRFDAIAAWIKEDPKNQELVYEIESEIGIELPLGEYWLIKQKGKEGYLKYFREHLL